MTVLGSALHARRQGAAQISYKTLERRPGIGQKIAVSPSVLRNQAAGEAGHQAETRGVAGRQCYSLAEERKCVIFFWQLSLLTMSGQADNEVSSCSWSL